MCKQMIQKMGRILQKHYINMKIQLNSKKMLQKVDLCANIIYISVKRRKNMKKTILFILFLGLMIIMLSTNVNAADVAVLQATPSKTTVQAGEEFTISLSLVDIDLSVIPLITNVEAKIDYDSNIFETIGQSDITSNILSIYTDVSDTGVATHELYLASTAGIQEGVEIAKITFRAKSNLVSTKSAITFEEVKVNDNSIADTVLNITIGAEEIPAATLSKIEISKKPTKLAYKIGEKFDNTGMEVNAVYSDGTSKVITNYTYAPMDELKETDNKITITYIEGLITKTAELKIYVNETGELPDTGIEDYGFVIIALAAVAIYSLIKLRRYSKI